ncbi:hypothetical protein [Nannocystis radixulma]|nr:hypothetical protein [Nannocystis radixulma]
MRLIARLCDVRGAGLRALGLTACLAHCGDGKLATHGSDASSTTSSSGAEDTSATSLRDLGDTGGAVGCVVEVWALMAGDDGWNGSAGGLALARSNVHAVGTLPGGASAILAVSSDGALAWGPKPLAHADPQAWFGPGVVGLASGDALTFTSGSAGAWLERWSPTGDSAGALAVPGDGYRLGPAALAPDGGIVAGGYVGAEAVLVSMSVEGIPSWEVRLDHDSIAAVAVDPSGSIFVLAVDHDVEGGDVYLEALDPAGLANWGALAGSNTGFAAMGALTPFAVTPDGHGGAYTLGQRHHLQTMDSPASDEMLLARYDATGEVAWEVRSEVPDVIDGGGLARVGDALIVSAVEAQSGTSLVIHRSDGTFVCDQVVAERRVRAVVASADDEVIVAGQATPDGPAWFARYRVAPQ